MFVHQNDDSLFKLLNLTTKEPMLDFWEEAGLFRTRHELSANLLQYDDKYEIIVNVANFDKDNISVEVKNNCVFITASKKANQSVESPEKTKPLVKYLVRELAEGASRCFKLPSKILEDSVVARCDNGLLRLTLPRYKADLSLAGKKLIKID